MNQKLSHLLGLFVLFIGTSFVWAQPDLEEGRILPRSETLEEMAAEAVLGTLQYAWDCEPDTYGFTDPPNVPVRFPSEYESTTGIYIGWPAFGGCTFPELTELVRIGLDQGIEVVLLTSSPSFARSCLSSRGIPNEQLDQIRFQTIPIDTIWGRDYLAEVVISSEKPDMDSRHAIDMSYYPQPWSGCSPSGRYHDDASPTQLAGLAIYNNVYRPQFRHEGGNIQTDGNGTCFSSLRALNYNRWSAWFYEPEDLDTIYQQYLGCNRLVLLEVLRGELTQHIDMWMTVISPDTIIVNRYDDPTDQHPEIERNVELLQSLGYRVVRIPAPMKYCSAGCPGSADPSRVSVCGKGYTRRVWATYANSIRIGNAMAVPVYRNVPEELRDDIETQEAEALATFAEELPSVEIVPVAADVIIPCEGAIHCVDITYK